MRNFQIVQIFYAAVTDDNFTTAEINQTKYWSLIVHLLNKIKQNIGL